MLYWYTYGPDYFKGDSFSDNLQTIALPVKAAYLLGKTEDVLWGATWACPPKVAIVKPRCSEFLGDDAQWENAKWVYTALAQAHVPVDPIDEVMLAQADLARYKAIYLNGSHLPRKSAEALARYVHSGGILWTSGWGCARDEANEPLSVLEPVLGLETRAEPELWYKVQRYGAVAVQSFADPRAALAPVPEGARIIGDHPYAASFLPVVGREVLKPAADTQTLARFADGAAAMTVHQYGKGRAYVVGFYPGLEYSATIRDGQPDMSRDLDAARRSFIAAPALTVTQPAVEPSVPAVEGVLLQNAALGKQCGRADELGLPAHRLDRTGQTPGQHRRDEGRGHRPSRCWQRHASHLGHAGPGPARSSSGRRAPTDAAAARGGRRAGAGAA